MSKLFADMSDFQSTIKEIEDSFPALKRLREADEKLRHEPVTLYCLGCGRIISKSFTGGLWSYTHPCNIKQCREDEEKMILCRIFGSKERGVMLPSSVILGFKNSKKCQVCKSEEQHISKVLEDLGLNQKFQCEDKEILKLREEAIEKVKKFCSSEYYDELIKLGYQTQ